MAILSSDSGLPSYEQIPSIHLDATQCQELRDDPVYGTLHREWEELFKLVREVRAVLDAPEETLDASALDLLIDRLKDSLERTHPVLPLLAGRIPQEEWSKLMPVVYKLVRPSVQALNASLGIPATDALLSELRTLVPQAFEPYEGDPPLFTVLGESFKGGAAVYHAHSPSVDQDVLGTFERRVGRYQLEMGGLLSVRSTSLPIALNGNPLMVFGGTKEWQLSSSKEERPLTTQDLVRGFILAEMIGNMTRRRMEEQNPSPERPLQRSPAILLKAVRFAEVLRKDFSRASRAFRQLCKNHSADPQWDQVIHRSSHIKEDPDNADAPGVPFLQQDLIQAVRKGEDLSKYSFIAPEEWLIIHKLLSVINMIDVLKPFLGEHLEDFCARLEQRASLIRCVPKGLKGKMDLLRDLWKEVKVSLKDSAPTGARPVEQTRLAVAEEIWEVCRQSSPLKLTYFTADVVKFAPRHLLGLYYQLYAFLGETSDRMREGGSNDESLLQALSSLLDSTGDVLSEALREGGQSFVGHFQTETSVRVVLDARGGDEVRALLVHSEEYDVNTLLRSFSYRNRLRSVLTAIPTGSADPDVLADGMALLELGADRELEALKKHPTPSNSVNMSFSQ